MLHLFQAPSEPHAGFVSGTVVHTAGGPARIEDIEVGTLVLAKPSVDGAVEARRVTAVQRGESAHVIELLVKWPRTDEWSGSLFPAVDHAFWVQGEGWLPARRLNSGFDVRRLVARGDDEAVAERAYMVYRTNDPQIGWISGFADAVDVEGALWDFERMEPIGEQVWSPEEVGNEEFDEPFIRRPVFNIVVEEWGNYFVGPKGLWVAGRRIDPSDD